MGEDHQIRVLVAGKDLWRGAVLLGGDPEVEHGYVTVELLRCGKQQLVHTSRVRTWDEKLRDTPHNLEPYLDTELSKRGAGPSSAEKEESSPSRPTGDLGTAVVVAVLEWCEDDEWGVMWGSWVPPGGEMFTQVPLEEADVRWNEAEGSGEVGRQAAARWAGEPLGICAPADCWHIFHPKGECGQLTGEEVVVLLLPQHPELRPEDYHRRDDSVHFVEDALPCEILSRIDSLVEEVWDNRTEETDTRGGS